MSEFIDPVTAAAYGPGVATIIALHGIRVDANGECYCQHRDVSCCPACLEATPYLKDCFGVVYVEAPAYTP